MLKFFGLIGVMILGGYATEKFVTNYFESKKQQIQTMKQVMQEGGIDALQKIAMTPPNPERDGRDVFGTTAQADQKGAKFYEATLVLKHECLAKKWPSGSGPGQYIKRSVAQKVQPDENISVDVKLSDLKEYENFKKAIKKDVCINSYVLHD